MSPTPNSATPLPLSSRPSFLQSVSSHFTKGPRPRASLFLSLLSYRSPADYGVSYRSLLPRIALPSNPLVLYWPRDLFFCIWSSRTKLPRWISKVTVPLLLLSALRRSRSTISDKADQTSISLIRFTRFSESLLGGSCSSPVFPMEN